MKRILLLTFVITIVFTQAQTPITLTSTDIASAGWTQITRKDTLPLPVINFGNKGANQVFDFSNLVWVVQDTLDYLTPTNPQLSNVPGADLAITPDGTNFLFTKTTSLKQTLMGFQGAIAGSILSAAYQTAPDVFHFPTQFGGNFIGTYSLTKTVPGSQVGQPGVYQVRLTITGNYTDTVDAWGKVSTPIGSYKCLRVKRKDTNTTLIEAQVSQFLPVWTTVSNKTATTIRYTYPAKETKGSVMSFEYDSVNNVTSATYSLIPPTAPVADFSFVLGAGGSVAFTDLSDFYPTSWAWTFGDAGTSTSQNPTHVYATNGTYNVCLIATNAGGSSVQVCKQVVVNTAAVQPVAAFTWANPSGGLVNFTDQSANTPTSWAWTFGDGGNSSSQSPSHVYTANGAYYVCLTATNAAGSNTFCDSVHVTNISAVNNAPVTGNDTASVLQPNGLIRNVGNNDNDPDGNTICITSIYGSSAFTLPLTGNCTSIQYTPDSTFVGNDTCYYILCDNGIPVLCDTGMFVVNSVYNPALLPVASFSSVPDLFNCSTQNANSNTIFNATSANANTFVWTITGGDSSLTDGGSSFVFNPSQLWPGYVFTQLEVCLTATNSFGSSTICDTSCTLIWSGINELFLSNVQLYPNPATNLLTIDMRNNNDEAVRNYSAIEIYNALGERVKTVNDRSKTVNISVAELTNGVYHATLVDSTGTRRMLGRFVVEK